MLSPRSPRRLTAPISLSPWAQIGESEDKRLAELNKSLDAIYEVVNEKLSASGSGVSAFSRTRSGLKAWRMLRHSTDPTTKEFLLAMERIRRDYDKGIIALTNSVQPLTDEEVRQGFEAAGGREIIEAIDKGVDSAFEIQHAIEEALQASLQPLTSSKVGACLTSPSGVSLQFLPSQCRHPRQRKCHS